MVQEKPLVTVLLATHNGSRFITTALTSVFAQTYDNFEFLIIDDASSDRTAEIVQSVKDPRVRYIRNGKQLRLSASLNRGLALARGTLIARVDDDDVWISPNKLARQVELMVRNPKLVLCGTHNIVVDQDQKELYRIYYPATDQDLRETMLYRNQFPHASVVFRTDLARKLRGYREDLYYAQDFELWLRMLLRGAAANVADCYIQQRGNLAGLSGSHQLTQWLGFFWAAWHYRRHYPGFWRHTPIYAREFILAALVPKRFFYQVGSLRRSLAEDLLGKP